eukprot:scaffold6148_cov282-Prasinococcus_capsulatus_cf.AAC.2
MAPNGLAGPRRPLGGPRAGPATPPKLRGASRGARAAGARALSAHIKIRQHTRVDGIVAKMHTISSAALHHIKFLGVLFVSSLVLSSTSFSRASRLDNASASAPGRSADGHSLARFRFG